MRNNKCVECGEELTEGSVLGSLCPCCTKKIWTNKWVEHKGLRIIPPTTNDDDIKED